jgi:ABC-type transport system involved in multi-copper enzyme maturation permease subunit
MLVGFYTYAQTETGGRAEFRYTYENRSYFNGLTFALYAFYFGAILLIPMFASIEGGSQIAGETAAGTLSLLLARPVARPRLFFAKLGIATLLLLVMVGMFLVAALLTGLFAVGWGDLSLYPGVLQMTDRPQHIPQAQALRCFLLAWPAATLAMLAPLSLSFLISTWSRSAINAVALSISLYLVLYVIAEVHFFKQLRPYLFTSYVTYWRGLFRSSIDWPLLLRDASRLLTFTGLFLTLAYHRFRVREEY